MTISNLNSHKFIGCVTINKCIIQGKDIEDVRNGHWLSCKVHESFDTCYAPIYNCTTVGD